MIHSPLFTIKILMIMAKDAYFKFVVTFSNGAVEDVYSIFEEISHEERTFIPVYDKSLEHIEINLKHIQKIEKKGRYRITTDGWFKVD